MMYIFFRYKRKVYNSYLAQMRARNEKSRTLYVLSYASYAALNGTLSGNLIKKDVWP